MAVFVTNNQAGSVALVLGGIVFLLILISGNPLLSLGHGDTQMRFVTRRRRVIQEAEEAPPREARSALEALSMIDPRASRDTAFIRTSGLVYERLVYAELTRLFPEFSVMSQGIDGPVHFDIIVATPERRAIFVELKSLQSPVSSIAVHQVTGMAATGVMGGLLVANQPLTRAARILLRQAQESGNNVSFVQWRDENDSDALKDAVLGLLRAFGHGSSNG
ncbi:restriction endonuclease [Streptomyces sp. C1-2]|uniref:restriction endonuclease n=1 Tax=Streptomyces sp. C1-2 TaxID=2720022 RepID=UPI0014326B0C|nr:restriction endonuclease [Streptomyces sp. C1-2]NJP70796.1 restriction endonuclease [Streptomyces sp. C1-2]